jgi:hypothetical protein
MPLIQPVFEQNLYLAIKAQLKAAQPKPADAGPEYDEGIDKVAKALAKALAPTITTYIQTATGTVTSGAGAGGAVIIQ